MAIIKDKFLAKLLQREAWGEAFRFRWKKHDPNFKTNQNYKVSICTTCMGRRHDVEQTLIQNIKDNINYPEVEFVLLDYNSRDSLDKWVQKNCMSYIEAGILNFYQMVNPLPQYYSMTHTRNLVFKIAKGQIVNNVDADHFTGPNFAHVINQIANQYPEKIIFAKSKQKNRGRLGFFKDEFINILGGYDEDIHGYGWDDKDILYRACHLGFHVCTYGGGFCQLTEDHRRHPVDNYKDKDWKYTQRLNTVISLFNIHAGRLKANQNTAWGAGCLRKNFKDWEYE